MARMGHDSTAAAIIYQHATRGADRAIADALSDKLAGADAADGTAPEKPPEDPEHPDDGAAGVLASVR
jgi:hypothetical protein